VGGLQVLQRVLLTLQRRAPSQLLAQELWVSARDAEAWWVMRQRYTASLALSSVATYLLGIGDRHLNNILVVQNSGQVRIKLVLFSVHMQ
jgi:phosphatidylinositol kinase/protein kinase (PI-3  family)